MRRAILKRFVLVLLAALCISSAIFYAASSRIILNTTKKDMLYTVHILDSVLDYNGDLERQEEQLKRFAGGDGSRWTRIDTDVSVLADSDAQPDTMDNHLNRREIREAVLTGEGYAIRRSETTNEKLLYVAGRSETADVVIRLALPYAGVREYLPLLLPSVLVSFLISLLYSLCVTKRFVETVTRPLQKISEEMMKVKGNYSQLQFDPSPYPELNVIAETTMKMSQNVKAYLAQIEREKQIRQEFFSNASHELKTPITSIQGYAELLESGMIEDEAMKKDFAGRIRKEAVNMSGLISDILMISQLESKEAEVVMSDVRISVLLEEIVDGLKAQAAASQVFIHVDCQPICMQANLKQMRELMTNLISNAIKYNHPGGQVWINVREQDGSLILRVRDNGMGIPADSLNRIFERFYRVDKGRSRKQGGTGLGLSIVKHIVNFYHGTIRVTSELEKGSEFVVSLPISRSAQPV